jgi:diaminopimelate epimerase
VTVDMGPPRLDWQSIPLAHAADTEAFPLSVGGQNFTAAAVSMGNPHCILFVENAERAPVDELGPAVERHPDFPARTNVEFVQVIAAGQLRVRVWERGAGRTRACGTGACAAAVAAHRRGFGPRTADVILDGGSLAIDWREADGHVLMTGPASFSFSGDVDFARLSS